MPSGLGKIKSFYFIPGFFSLLIIFWGATRERLVWLFGAWLLGLSAAAGASLTAASFGWFLYDGRLAGPYQSANYLALLLAPGVPLSIFFFSSYRSILIRVLTALSGSLIVVVLYLTHSYSTWLGVMVGLLSLAWMQWRTKRRQFVLILGLLLCLGGIGIFQEQESQKWQSLISGDSRTSLASRLIIWRVAGRAVTESFPWGIGPGRFQEVYLGYQPLYQPYLEWAVPTPHNLYLTLLLEGGVLTLIGFLGVLTYVFRHPQMRALTVEAPEASSGLSTLACALLVLYLVSGLVDTPYMKNDLALAVWGCLGLCVAALRIRA